MAFDPITDLILQTAREDRTAFRALYRQAGPKLMGVLLRILKDRADAEDALQELFTKIWLKARAYDPARGAGMAWLVVLARNAAIDRLRLRAPLQAEDSALDLVADPAPGAVAALEARGEARRIGDCLAALEADRAAAVKGAYLDGQSYQDLAQRFGVPLNTMRTWLRRSLLRLRECMET